MERRGPLLRLEELDHSELELVNREFLDRLQGRAEDIDQIYEAYAQALHSWGIICPHPQQHRMYDGFHKTDVPLKFDESRWFECRLCGTAVINR